MPMAPQFQPDPVPLRRRAWPCAVLLLALAGSALSQEPPHAPALDSPDGPTIGVALSGGGARGLAHIGVLKALEELRIPIHAIAGTSIGAMAGALYASGMKPAQMEQLVGAIPWRDVLSDEVAWRDRRFQEKQEQRQYFLGLELGLAGEGRRARSGVIAGHQLELFLRRLTEEVGTLRFEALSIPFRAVATDMNAAESYVMAQGNLARALRASMAVPVLFEPVNIDGHLLVDGGILNNLPVDVAREMGAEVVIAVDISSPLGEVRTASSLFEVAYQSVDTALIQNTLRSLATADLVVAPDLGELSSADFEASAELIRRGYEATMARRRFLETLSVSPEQYASWQAATTPEIQTPAPTIDFVRFVGNERTAEARLAATTRDLVGQRATYDNIEPYVNRIYAMQSFLTVGYDIETDEAGGEGVVFRLIEKSWGPHYLKFGFAIASDIDVDTDFSLFIGHRMRNVNALGGEWLNDIQVGSGFGWRSELYQPLDYHERRFIAPYLRAEQRKQRVFDDPSDDQLAEFDIFSAALGLDVGLNFEHSRLRAGLWRGLERSNLEIGADDAPFPDYDVQEGAVRLEWQHDSLNDRLFANRGAFAQGTLNLYREALGSEADHEQLDLRGYVRVPFGRASALHLEGLARLLEAGDEPLPESAFVTLGGLDDLAGFPTGSLIGTRAMLFRAGVISGITPWELPVIGAPRIIALAHGGHVWQEDESVDLHDLQYGASAGLAVDLLGAILFAGTGYTEGGDMRYYVRIGTGF